MLRRSVDRPGRGRGSRGRAACTRPGRAGKRTRSFHAPCGKGRATTGPGSTALRQAAQALHQGRGGADRPSLYLRPDPRMYHHASAALGLAPAQCLFVDDDPDLVAAAIRLGYAGRALCRDTAISDVPSITSLTEILHFF
ncbi:HAD-IA family hydrolase [Streptomyces sp. NPDC001480]|uniref:HAD-IA family hydrolase n=1 Tax=Streptomyces sp. NPDC001480 TaxID=3364577 RepID=UPI0036C1B848